MPTNQPPPGFGKDDMFASIDEEYRVLKEIARQAELYLYGSELGRNDARIKLQVGLERLRNL